MFCIRKPLSRKFNIICLNLAGLLARSMLPILPIQKMNSGFVASNIPISRCQNKFGINIQLREQLRFCTGFPFNPTNTPWEPKFRVKANQSV